MPKTLVTGATGYLGRHLVNDLLADGVPVRALVYSDWKAEALAERGVEVVLGDVTEPEALAGIVDGVEAVFHLVGGGNDGRTDPFRINTQATRNMVAACRSARLRAFVYVSSSSVYGRQDQPVNEETPAAPRFDYPQSKFEAEAVLLEAAEKGLPAMVARMAGIYGPDAPMVATQLVRRGQLRITGDGLNRISVIHIDDAVQALRAMAARGQPGRIYCIGDDEPVQVLTFHNHYARLIGAPPVGTSSIQRTKLIIGTVRFLSKLVGRQPPLTEAVIEMSTLNVMMRNQRIKQELGVALRYPTYREGLAQCAEALLGPGDEGE